MFKFEVDDKKGHIFVQSRHQKRSYAAHNEHFGNAGWAERGCFTANKNFLNTLLGFLRNWTLGVR
jgi:hypothetical protein